MPHLKLPKKPLYRFRKEVSQKLQEEKNLECPPSGTVEKVVFGVRKLAFAFL